MYPTQWPVWDQGHDLSHSLVFKVYGVLFSVGLIYTQGWIYQFIYNFMEFFLSSSLSVVFSVFFSSLGLLFLVFWPKAGALFIPLSDVLPMTDSASEARWWEDKVMELWPSLMTLHVQSQRRSFNISSLGSWGPPLVQLLSAWPQDCLRDGVQENGVLEDPFPTSWVRTRGLLLKNSVCIMPTYRPWAVLKLGWRIPEGKIWWTYYQFDSIGLFPQSSCYYLLFGVLK